MHVCCVLSSSSTPGWQLLSVQRSFTAYYERFKAVLNPINAQNVQRLLHIASALHKCLQQDQQQQQQQGGRSNISSSISGSSSSSSRVVTANDLLFELGLDNFNMFELARWVKDNKMAFKVRCGVVSREGGGRRRGLLHCCDMPCPKSERQGAFVCYTTVVVGS